MDRRLELHSMLVVLLESENVYFQPPPSKEIVYPCIVYERDANDTTFADDKPYRIKRRYEAIVIDRDPDTTIPDKLARLSLCKMGKPYTADNLYHYPFTIYY